MPLNLNKFTIGLTAGVAFLLNASGAFANTSIPGQLSQLLAQSNTRTPEDIIIDTPAQGRSTTTTTTTTSGSGSNTTVSQDTRFTCEVMDGEYTVVYRPEERPGQYYPWAKPSAMGGRWTPQARCVEISRRLEAYRYDNLREMKTSVLNNQDIVCVTTERVPGCRIVFTVPPGQNPKLTRDRVFENLTVAEAGQQTDAVNTFIGNGSSINQVLNGLGIPGVGGKKKITASPDSINLRPFLSPSDGGNGSNLTRGTKVRSNSRPSLFR